MNTDLLVRQSVGLPDEATLRQDVAAINHFQKIVRATLVDGQDFGVIPGTDKPTLLKPGAEKIAKLLGLADDYEVMDKQEDWVTGFFNYTIRCKLTNIGTGALVSSGIGECNSMESKYRWRWVYEKDIPVGLQKDKLVSKEFTVKTGGKFRRYRIDNDDIYSQVNTILKMAKKRALVDAALSAGRLSDVFTQDIEDLGAMPAKTSLPPAQTQPVTTPQVVEVEGEDVTAPAGWIDEAWLQDAHNKLPPAGRNRVAKWMADHGATGKSVVEMARCLNPENAKDFYDFIELLKAGR